MVILFVKQLQETAEIPDHYPISKVGIRVLISIGIILAITSGIWAASLGVTQS